MMQTIIEVCIVRNLLVASAKYAQDNFLTVLSALQGLRGVKGTDPC
jgi:hypothetical protein